MSKVQPPALFFMPCTGSFYFLPDRETFRKMKKMEVASYLCRQAVLSMILPVQCP